MSKSSNPNNSAGRLLAICLQFLDMESMRIGAAWAKILNVPERDEAKLLSRIGVAVALVDATKRDILALPKVNADLYLEWEKPVSMAFGKLNLQQSGLNEIKALLKPEVILSLRYCDNELSNHVPENILDSEVLDSILDDIRELLDKILSNSLPIDLENFLVDKLTGLERAIELYPLTGAKPIEDELDSVIGATFRKGKDWLDKQKAHDVNTEFWAICARIATTISLWEGATKLLEFVENLRIE